MLISAADVAYSTCGQPVFAVKYRLIDNYIKKGTKEMTKETAKKLIKLFLFFMTMAFAGVLGGTSVLFAATDVGAWWGVLVLMHVHAWVGMYLGGYFFIIEELMGIDVIYEILESLNE